MVKKHKGTLAVIEQIYEDIPAFTDIFTEESFYTFVFCFVCATIIVAFILSRFITLKPVEF
ncbi:PREDICTED: uncharacterized protein LOC108968502 [Bactrocera latifrons]|uniref:Uncharacterized protein LOC109579441 n=1 Tax=Bactrocera dorsalis TaxID=27457 RepID=A0A6J0RHZ6_BACDO|nr:PREDICTED: uncharacterized protein LOC108968502 [Bactrocera latifrons]XP_019845246.1 uncharacterized protein LOC109579441 [Bactrocera dorsalis]XP_039953672.1 uncharacterized protein LOC120770340 [Bactrocera tryoni]XP_050327525.1 uncharacterized protein LOC126757569 [Bactrocera neohumeralis]